MYDESDEAIAARIKIAMRNGDIRNKDLAEALDVSEQTVYLWRTTGKVARQYWAGLCERLNVSIEWLLTGKTHPAAAVAESPAEYRTSPKLVSYWGGHEQLSAGDVVLVAQGYKGGAAKPVIIPASLVKERQISRDRLVVLTATDASMAGNITVGDQLVVDLGDRDIKDGQVYALEHRDKTILKRIYHRFDGSLLLHSDNESMFPDEVISADLIDDLIVGHVIWQSRALA